jgi:hypothetical protein
LVLNRYPAMRRILLSFFVAGFFASAAFAIEVGDAAADVRVALGNPVALRKKADGDEIWKFKDGTTVWLSGDAVQKIAGPAAGNRVLRPPSMEWLPLTVHPLSASPAQLAASPSVKASQRAKEAPATDAIRMVRYFMAAGGVLLAAGLARSLFAMLRFGGEWLLGFGFRPVGFFTFRWNRTHRIERHRAGSKWV